MTDDPLINQQLDEYLIETLLGKGGMARVYRGVDVNLKRYVAIKVIDSPYQRDSDYTMRFEREAQVIAQLSHPNVVQLYRYGKAEDFLYMVMQYIQGADLHTILSGYRQDNESMQPDEVRQVTGDVCRALDYIHGQGVVHRDVKPSNILLTRDGRAILSDFGLALLTEIGTLGRIFGSPQYIAPEQAISSAQAEPRSDLYSLGVILYEIFTGRLPFAAEDPLELAMQHVQKEPPRPRQFRPGISQPIEAFLLKALAKKPEDRYPSGAAFYQALDQALASTEEALAAMPSTISHLTIPERVKIQADSDPLPAIGDQEREENRRGERETGETGEIRETAPYQAGARLQPGGAAVTPENGSAAEPETMPYDAEQREGLGLRSRQSGRRRRGTPGYHAGRQPSFYTGPPGDRLKEKAAPADRSGRAGDAAGDDRLCGWRSVGRDALCQRLPGPQVAGSACPCSDPGKSRAPGNPGGAGHPAGDPTHRDA